MQQGVIAAKSYMKGDYEEFHALKAAKKQSQSVRALNDDEEFPDKSKPIYSLWVPSTALSGQREDEQTELRGYSMTGETVVVDNLLTGKMIERE